MKIKKATGKEEPKPQNKVKEETIEAPIEVTDEKTDDKTETQKEDVDGIHTVKVEVVQHLDVLVLEDIDVSLEGRK